jgi:hypothetical protein
MEEDRQVEERKKRPTQILLSKSSNEVEFNFGGQEHWDYE